ncbi:MAG: 2,3-bisphosphoglycerate-independent phosphoglycerate mutase [Spirochaetales bacterium]|nr:2,3-bisphosphoglycerate-independent phosphoglycerate mutase [Spirochaetales bacterium]
MVDGLKKHSKMSRRQGPVVLVIMDGVGYGKYAEGDAVLDAKTPNLDALAASCPATKLFAHGTYVGLPSDDDMGNSEVGHNAIGCGRVFAQGAKLVSAAIESNLMFEGATWQKLTANTKEKESTLHFIGLLSDGNVHSHINHLKAMIKKAKADGVKKVRVHALLDGRDVGETSALDYFQPMEDFLKELSVDGFDARIASGGGRMNITMDRYNANWDMVKKGWETHVLGEGRFFADSIEAINVLREETNAIDQDLPPFVIADNGKAIGTIEDGDSVIFFNFRGDRALEMTASFETKGEFKYFDRKRVPSVEYAGMMEYDGDLHIPSQYLVVPPAIDRTMGEFFCASGVKTFAISETQKYGHVTYFFNGNKLGKLCDELEEYEEILSDVIPFEQKPLMKCKEITDRVVDVIAEGKFDFIRLNFPNGDMVGHTGVYKAVIESMEGLDAQIGRLKEAVEKAGGVMIISADHGNADDMYEHKKSGEVVRSAEGKPKAKTSHSLNPVPCIIFDPVSKGEYKKELKSGLGISSLAATCMEFLGFEKPEDYNESVLDF